MFQGRFHALPTENYQIMARVVDYVHLNPVRAHVVTGVHVAQYRWSSLNRFVQRTPFAGLEFAGALAGRGWEDTPEGWAGYVGYLAELAGSLE